MKIGQEEALIRGELEWVKLPASPRCLNVPHPAFSAI
jgi:hypothetical protein